MKKRFCLILALLTLFSIFSLPSVSMAKDEMKNTDPDKYYIELDTNNNICTVYEKDDNGEYTRIVRCFMVSTGKKADDESEEAMMEASPTPSGVWKIGGKERFGKFAKFSEYARYWTQLVQDVYFHSIMFTKRDFSSLMSSPFGNLGGNVSHGCIRCLVEDAKWIYYYACPGTTVRVFKGKTNKPLKTALRRARSAYTFKEYKALQANFYDTDEPYENDRCWVTNEEAGIRKESKTASKRIQSLELGEELEILIYNDAWIKVRSSAGKEGYVFRGYVSLQKDASDTTENATLIKATTWMFSEKNKEDEFRVCKVPTDTTVQVLETDEETGFTKIAYSGLEGYVQSKFLRTGLGIDLNKTQAGIHEENMPAVTETDTQNTTENAKPVSGTANNTEQQ